MINTPLKMRKREESILLAKNKAKNNLSSSPLILNSINILLLLPHKKIYGNLY